MTYVPVVWKDASVTVNSVDLSNHVDEVEVDEKWANLQTTAMGASAETVALGLVTPTVKVTFLQDNQSGSVDATLRAVKGSNTAFPVVIKPTSAAVSTTNPSYTMQAVLDEYAPISGKVGDLGKVTVTFKNADPAGIVLATS